MTAACICRNCGVKHRPWVCNRAWCHFDDMCARCRSAEYEDLYELGRAEPVAVVQTVVETVVEDPTTDLPMWTVYDHPDDFPNSWVVRRFVVRAGQVFADELPWAMGTEYEQVRQTIPPGLMVRPRGPSDDPKTVEVWM